MTKPMTPAQYAAHTEKVKAEQQPTEIVTLTSGSVFELRRVNLQEMVQIGVIPQSLLSESLKAMKHQNKYVPTDTPEIRIDGLILQREVVAAACVMPPFNEDTAKSFLKQDFDEIYHWAMSQQEVEKAKGLKSFRKGRKRGTSGDRADSEKLQPQTISTAEN